jgi:hypothetical protein
MTEQWDGAERRRDPTESVHVLAGAVDGLSSQVSGLRDQIATVDTKRKRNLLWLIPVAALLAYSFYDRGQIKTLAEREAKQTLGSAVAVCAMQNVVRIEINNFLAEAQNQRVFDEPGDSSQALQATEARRAFLTEARKRFELVPCEALVAGEEVHIELRYPPTIPVTTP